MKNNFFCILMVIVCIFTLTACAEMQGRRGQAGALFGAAGGALIGQMIGHNSEATLIGAAVGTMLGYIVGNEMDSYDRQQLNDTFEQGASGQTSSWINPDTRNQYWVTPNTVYKKPIPRRQRRSNQQYRQQRQPPQQQICRKAEIVAIIDGRRERTYTTACRDNKGKWQLQQ